MHGTFVEANPALAQDVTLTDQDPYGEGWLYAMRGHPGSDALDVQGYVALLDATVDRMKEETAAGKPPKNC
jgi:glycine cleavage system H protein